MRAYRYLLCSTPHECMMTCVLFNCFADGVVGPADEDVEDYVRPPDVGTADEGGLTSNACTACTARTVLQSI